MLLQRLPLLIERLSALHDFSRQGIEGVLYECTEQAPLDHTDPKVSILARCALALFLLQLWRLGRLLLCKR